MCFLDYDAPTFCAERIRRAAKAHPCSECPAGIRAGEHYQEVTGLWDGWLSRFRVCARCHWDRWRVYQAELAEGCEPEESWAPFGGLDQALTDRGWEPSPVTYRGEVVA